MADPRPEGSAGTGKAPLFARLWPAALFLVVAATIAVTAISVLALRDASSTQQRLLEDEVAALVLTYRAIALSQARARLAHEALLSGSPESEAAALAASDELGELLRRARRDLRGGGEHAEVLARLERAQERTLALWSDSARGPPAR